MNSCLVIVALALVALASQANAKCGCDAIYRQKRQAGADAFPRDKDGLLVVGDMHLEPRAAAFFFADNKTAAKFRAASTHGPHKWPGNKLPYLIGKDVAQEASKIRDALSAFQKALGNCVTFQEISAPQGDHVQVFNGGDGACFSNVGRSGGMQKLSLGRGCTNSPATIQHEFMHALGFYHEQSRPDRDNFIRIDFDKTENDFCGNYMKCKACNTITPYNIKSIMHYPSIGFGCNGVPTIFTKSNQQIPYNHVIQDTDIQNIKWLYGCK